MTGSGSVLANPATRYQTLVAPFVAGWIYRETIGAICCSERGSACEKPGRQGCVAPPPRSARLSASASPRRATRNCSWGVLNPAGFEAETLDVSRLSTVGDPEVNMGVAIGRREDSSMRRRIETDRLDLRSHDIEADLGLFVSRRGMRQIVVALCRARDTSSPSRSRATEAETASRR